MYLTSREAAARLDQAHHIGLTRARDALAAGLAGPALAVGRQRMYEVTAVENLASRVRWGGADPRYAFPEGVVIVRVKPTRGLDLTTTREDQLATVSSGWRVSLPVRLALALGLQRRGSYRFIATVAGFAALGAEITSFHASESENPGDVRTRFEFADPDPDSLIPECAWWPEIANVRFDLGAGHEIVVKDPVVRDGHFRRIDRLTTYAPSRIRELREGCERT